MSSGFHMNVWRPYTTITTTTTATSHEGYGNYRGPSRGVIPKTGKKGLGSQIPPSTGSDKERLSVAAGGTTQKESPKNFIVTIFTVPDPEEGTGLQPRHHTIKRLGVDHWP